MFGARGPFGHKVIRQRTPSKLATTTYANEIAQVVNDLSAPLSRFGQMEAPGASVTLPFRAKIKTFVDSNGVAVVNAWDGANLGTADIPARVFVNFAVGQELFVERVTGNDVEYNGAKISFQESGACQYQTFPVRLTSDGGSAGTNQSSACTLTYTVKDASNTITLAENVAITGKGNGWRALKLELTAATRGLAYLDADEVVLIDADECPAGENDCR
jgi:hypothetical protein